MRATLTNGVPTVPEAVLAPVMIGGVLAAATVIFSTAVPVPEALTAASATV